MIAIILTLFVFIIYSLTMSHTVVGVDSGDMVSAAALLGVAHPPGYPLYTMIGYLFTRLPIDESPVWKVNLFSAVTTSISIGLLYLTCKNITKNIPLSAITALTFGFTYIIWFYANFAEVFPLNTLFVILLLYLLTRWEIKDKKINKNLYLIAFVSGLSLTHHHTISLFLLLLWLYIYKSVPVADRHIKRLIYLSIPFVVGLLPYLYVPLAASRNPIINWENADTINGFFRLITRAVYGTFKAHYLTDVPAGLERARHIGFYSAFLRNDFMDLGIALALLGAIWLFFNKRKFAYLIIGSFLITGPLFLSYANFPSSSYYYFSVIERFIIMSYVFFAILLACGLALFQGGIVWVINHFVPKKNKNSNLKMYVPVVFAILLSLYPGYLLLKNWNQVDLSNNRMGEEYVRDIFRTVPQKSILILFDDNALFNAQYLHYVEGLRQDIVLLDGTGIRNEYMKRKVHEMYPDLKLPVGDKNVAPEIEFLYSNSDRYNVYILNGLPNVPGKKWIPEGMLNRLVDEDYKFDKSQAEKSEKLWKGYTNNTQQLLQTKGNVLLSIFRIPYEIGQANAYNYYIQNKEHNLALQHLTEAIALNPYSINYQIDKAAIYGDMGQCKEAIKILNTEIIKHPYQPLIAQNLSQAYRDCGDKEKSEEYANLKEQIDFSFERKLRDIK